jgi:hypothetical protein
MPEHIEIGSTLILREADSPPPTLDRDKGDHETGGFRTKSAGRLLIETPQEQEPIGRHVNVNQQL